MLFSNATTTSSLFKPFYPVYKEIKEWECYLIQLKDATGEIVNIGEYSYSESDKFTILLDDDREIKAISAGDVHRIIIELGVRGDLDKLISWARE
tara:strand:+ start:384 stop:668 length:285 start_codon:yes stop_codon:yes gene_type:complete